MKRLLLLMVFTPAMALAQTPTTFTGSSSGNSNPLTANALNSAFGTKQDTITSGNAANVRAQLGLGSAAQLTLGTTAGTVAAGNDSRILGALQGANNLSDVANAATALANLGGVNASGAAAAAPVRTFMTRTGNISLLAADITAALGFAPITSGQIGAVNGVAPLDGSGNVPLLNLGNVVALKPANNLSDVASAATARTNIGLGTMATQAAGAVAITGGTVAADASGSTYKATGTGSAARTIPAHLSDTYLSVMDYSIVSNGVTLNAVADAQSCTPLVTTTAGSAVVTLTTNTLTVDGTLNSPVSGYGTICAFGAAADLTGQRVMSVPGAGGTTWSNGHQYGPITSATVNSVGSYPTIMPSAIVIGPAYNGTTAAYGNGGVDAVLVVTGGVVSSGSIVAVGAGCTNGSNITATIQGGPTGSTAGSLVVTVASGVLSAVTGINATGTIGGVGYTGQYTGSVPADPVKLTVPGCTTPPAVHLNYGVTSIAVTGPSPAAIGGQGYDAATPGYVSFGVPGSGTQVVSTASTISGTTLTVGGTVSGGQFGVGTLIGGANVTAGTTITSRGTGTGGVGTYNLSAASTVATPEMIAGGIDAASTPATASVAVAPITLPLVANIIGVTNVNTNTAQVTLNANAAVSLTAAQEPVVWGTPIDTAFASAKTQSTAQGGTCIYFPAQNNTPYLIQRGLQSSGDCVMGAAIAPHVANIYVRNQPWGGYARLGSSIVNVDPIHPAISMNNGGSISNLIFLQQQVVNQSPAPFVPYQTPYSIEETGQGATGNNSLSNIWTEGTTYGVIIDGNGNGSQAGNLSPMTDMYLGDLIIGISAEFAEYPASIKNIQIGNSWLGPSAWNSNGVNAYRSANTTCLNLQRWDTLSAVQVNCGIANTAIYMANMTQNGSFGGLYQYDFSNFTAFANSLITMSDAGVYTVGRIDGLNAQQAGGTNSFINVSDYSVLTVGGTWQAAPGLPPITVGSGVGGTLILKDLTLGQAGSNATGGTTYGWTSATPMATINAGGTLYSDGGTYIHSPPTPLFAGAGTFILNGNPSPNAQWLDVLSAASVSGCGTATVSGTYRHITLNVTAGAPTSCTITLNGTLTVAAAATVQQHSAAAVWTGTGTTTTIVLGSTGLSGVYDIYGQ